jgi:hypothetical protein
LTKAAQFACHHSFQALEICVELVKANLLGMQEILRKYRLPSLDEKFFEQVDEAFQFELDSLDEDSSDFPKTGRLPFDTLPSLVKHLRNIEPFAQQAGSS